MVSAVVLLTLTWSAVAQVQTQATDYDTFSNPDGSITTEQQHAAAFAMVHHPEQLEAVYSDAVKGNARARRTWQWLEASYAGAGEQVAETVTRSGCLVPIYSELSGTCRPDWSSLSYLSEDRPGAAHLRKAIFDAFAAKARERGLQNQAILAAANGFVSVGIATAALRGAARVPGTTTTLEAPVPKLPSVAKSPPPRLPPAPAPVGRRLAHSVICLGLPSSESNRMANSVRRFGEPACKRIT